MPTVAALDRMESTSTSEAGSSASGIKGLAQNLWQLPKLPMRFTGCSLLDAAGEYVIVVATDTLASRPVTIKCVPRDHYRQQDKNIRREIENLYSLSLYRHPCLVTLLEVFYTTDLVCLVYELHLPNTSLERLLERVDSGMFELTQSQAKLVFQQLVLVIDFSHMMGVVHRDIRPQVIYVGTGMHIKLAGFGLSRRQDFLTQPKTRQGMVLYTPPEVLSGMDGDTYDGEAVDVWSCGVVLYTLMFGGHPFISLEDLQLARADSRVLLLKMMNNCLAGNVILPPEASEMPEVVALLQRMLHPDPDKRCTIKDVLHDTWFRDGLSDTQLNLSVLLLERGPAPPHEMPSLAEVEALLTAASGTGNVTTNSEGVGYTRMPAAGPPSAAPHMAGPFGMGMPGAQHAPTPMPTPVGTPSLSHAPSTTSSGRFGPDGAGPMRVSTPDPIMGQRQAPGQGPMGMPGFQRMEPMAEGMPLLDQPLDVMDGEEWDVAMQQAVMRMEQAQAQAQAQAARYQHHQHQQLLMQQQQALLRGQAHQAPHGVHHQGHGMPMEYQQQLRGIMGQGHQQPHQPQGRQQQEQQQLLMALQGQQQQQQQQQQARLLHGAHQQMDTDMQHYPN